MELEYFFNGIELRDGLYPRARVMVMAKVGTLPADMALPRIDITLPIGHLEAPTGELAQAALQAARQLLNEQALSDWVNAQSG